ncbi:hypothetical protein ACKLNR_010491 [Fusarium oxysporum f. sp. zingiberi]|nr:hypothetical protein QWA68_004575 [Fusarium oxysporum]
MIKSHKGSCGYGDDEKPYQRMGSVHGLRGCDNFFGGSSGSLTHTQPFNSRYGPPSWSLWGDKHKAPSPKGCQAARQRRIVN